MIFKPLWKLNMTNLFQLQKLCQLDTRRLLLLMGLVFTVVLVFQSSVLPHGNILSSLFYSSKTPLLGKSIPPTPSTLESDRVNRLMSLNNSNASTLSSAPWTANSTEAYDMGKQNEHSGGTHNISFPENVLHGRSSTRENVISPDSGYTLENAKEPGHTKDLKQSNSTLPVHNVQNADSRTVETFGNTIASVSSVPPALTPVLSSDNFTLLGRSDSDSYSSVPIIPVTPYISPVSKQPTEVLHEDENTYPPPSGSVTSNANKTMAGGAVVSSGQELQTPILKLNSLLLQSHGSVHAMRPLWSSQRDHELVSAKSQISNAPIIKDDPELYPSVYRNASVFKRSYELMEELLKVYIYSDGEKPIFHEATEPILKGIYASEGWFMRQMEQNKQFVVKDPTKAHLFYLPISSRMLQLELYVRNSHSRKNLADYMKNYVDMIATKYPFWNRTGGADHFIVACHDWAPYETRGHMDNCLKVLCNANIARDFKIGKDVALPESQVRKITDPLRGLGGNPPLDRPIIAFFAGGMHGSLRPILLQYWGNKDPDMKIYGTIPNESTMNYVQHMKNSKYCICARGYDVHSPRVVEAIFFECVPVIISDGYVPPLFEILDWEAFAVFVPEKDVPNLKEILVSIPEENYLEMHRRVKSVQKHFLWHIEPVKYDIFHMILHSVWFNRLNML